MKPLSVRYESPSKQFSTGLTLLEVVLSMAVFALGLMALAHLQINLTRSDSDANYRTIASNIAEETIEDLRAFEQISTDPAGVKTAYQDIVDKTVTVQRGNLDLTLNLDVVDYYFLADRVSVSSTAPAGVTASDFKHLELTVSWNTNQQFQVDETSSSTGQLNSGSVSISSIIPSISPLGSAKIAAEADGIRGAPPVDYSPGLNPDIVAVQVAQNKFKESTTPAPVVRRRDELIETWFDVITYSSNGGKSTFDRREEFVSTSCQCTLRAPAGGGEDGLRPTVWTGAEYREGDLVGKPYGEVANNQQSQYCDVCCRDHHDTGAGTDSYRPHVSSSDLVASGVFKNDHIHYNRTNKGLLVPALLDGDDYIEACRLVRRDGFFRVAQDFDLKKQIALPEDYLDTTTEIQNYSAYVTSAVSDHYANGTSPLVNHSLNFSGRDNANPTDLPTTWSNAANQQLRSRGIYTDVISASLQANLDNCFGSGVRADCEAPGAVSALEIYPFFELQLTKLSRWSETQPNNPVDVTNDELATDNSHDRGKAFLATTTAGMSTSHSRIETGNVGLISTQPMVLQPLPQYSQADIYVRARNSSTPPPPSGSAIITGTINSEGSTSDAAIVSVVGSGANCTKPTNTTFQCVLDSPIVLTPTITVSNYYKKNTNLIACSVLLTQSFAQGASASANWTRFFLPLVTTSNIVITISRAPCI